MQRSDYCERTHAATTIRWLRDGSPALHRLCDAVISALCRNDANRPPMPDAPPTGLFSSEVDPAASDDYDADLYARATDAIVQSHNDKQPLMVALAVSAFTASVLAQTMVRMVCL